MLQFLLILFYIVLAYFLLDFYRRKSEISIGRKAFTAYYFLKLAMAFALTALYTFYYTDRAHADIYKFFDDSAILHQLAFTDTGTYLRLFFGLPLSEEAQSLILDTQHWDASAAWGGTGNRMMTRVHLLIRWFSFANIWVHSIIFSAVSVLGFMWMCRALEPFFKKPQWIFIPFLMPSVLFWSSGMLKETLLVFFIGLAFNAYFHFKQQSRIFIAIALFGFACFFVFLLKPYVLLAAFPFFLFAILYRLPFFSKKNAVWSISISLVLAFILLNTISQIVFGHSLAAFLILRYNDFLALAIRENAGSLLNTAEMQVGLLWLKNSIVNIWALPWPWQSGGFLIKLAGLEQVIITLGIIGTTYMAIKISRKTKSFSYFFCFFLFAILLFEIIGLSVPVLGAIVRYKMPGVLFLMLFCTFIWDKYFQK